MPNPELLQTLDYILNRCDEGAIEAVAAAVLRRRRELAMFGGSPNLPDPHRMAREFSSRLDISGAIQGLKASVRDMALRIIRQEAPDLSAEQAEELANAWIPAGGAPQAEGPPGENSPGENSPGGKAQGAAKTLPEDLLRSMIGQFVAFSQGAMDKNEDQGLRAELGPWPERYWKAFPPVIRLFITDYLKGEIGEKDFRGKIETALSMGL
ncbi:MAG: hypothetical protein LBO76_08160 [Treponema sp.]|jgi:hypothetical protein|nr:hypothetical protein [Treponema sp.]